MDARTTAGMGTRVAQRRQLKKPTTIAGASCRGEIAWKIASAVDTSDSQPQRPSAMAAEKSCVLLDLGSGLTRANSEERRQVTLQIRVWSRMKVWSGIRVWSGICACGLWVYIEALDRKVACRWVVSNYAPMPHLHSIWDL